MTVIRMASALLTMTAVFFVSGTSQLQFAPPLLAGVSAVPITPFGTNPDWHGPITAGGVWGESFTDLNHNGRWHPSEPFVVDDRNSGLDSASLRDSPRVPIIHLVDSRKCVTLCTSRV